MNRSPGQMEADDHRTATHTVTRRAGISDGPAAEVYDSDGLPVLIRLPDLSSSRTARRDTGSRSAKVPTAPTAEPVPVVAGTGAVSGGPRQGNRRVPQRHRRSPTGHAVAGTWLRSLGRWLMPPVLAGILLAIIITVRDAGKSAPVAEDRDGTNTPPLRWEPSGIDPAGSLLTEEPSNRWGMQDGASQRATESGRFHAVIPASLDYRDGEPMRAQRATEWGTEDRRSGRVVVPEATGYADNVETRGVPDRHPVAGHEPHHSSPERSGADRAGSWRESLPTVGRDGGDGPHTDLLSRPRR